MLSSGQQTKIVECECQCSHVKVVSDYDVYRDTRGPDPIINQSYYLSFYGYGHVRKPGLWWKLRQCFQILRKGTPYEDMVIMTPEEAQKLADFITFSRV